MNDKTVLDRIYDHKIAAIIRGVKPAMMQQTVSALINGGIRVLEVTFDNSSRQGIDETIESLSIINSSFSDEVFLGAGTVLTTTQVMMAKEAGASFIISPHTDQTIISKTKTLDLISIPGAFTPTEIVMAYNSGADIVKLFPAGILGLGYIKAVAAPLSHIPFMAVGGITPDNINDFINAGISSVGIGSNLVNLEHISNGEFDKITKIAQSFVKRIKEGEKDNV